MSEGRLVAGGASLICRVRASGGVEVAICEEFVSSVLGVTTEAGPVSFKLGNGSVVGICVSADWLAGGDKNSGRCPGSSEQDVMNNATQTNRQGAS